MASYVKKTITCMCCGKKYEANLLKGYSVENNNVLDLDTNPHNPALFDRVLFCPFCGYATSAPYSALPDDIKALVNDANYKEVLNNRRYDDICRKLLLAGYLSVKIRNAKEAGYNYLLAYWYMRDNKIAGCERAREKAIKNFERYLLKTVDCEVAMILVDLLRQSERFEDAKETVLSLESYIADNTELARIAEFEKKLISKKDSDIHKVEEVSV
jgi:hypothetical protein